MPLNPAYLDPQSCPAERPPIADMHDASRDLHDAIDSRIRERGIPYLHPDGETLQLDLLGSPRMIAWRENKAAFLFAAEGCWSSLPQVYARYGTETTRALLATVRELEHAEAAVLTDCGMQACALLFDVLVTRGSHAVICRQCYNKTKTYLDALTSRVGASMSIVDDGDLDALAGAIDTNTCLVFAETFSNPLLRAVDPDRLGQLLLDRRAAGCRRVRLILDDTIATPWGLRRPLLDFPGVDFVVASGTKALAGQDLDLWGYVASNDVDRLNEIMDLQAMRGGILDWRRAAAVLEHLPRARADHERRCATAARVAAFLESHPRVSGVFHPSLPGHPDRAAIDAWYALGGSLLSFRVDGLDEDATRHFCDVLATTVLPRYALSFDGLATKLNHHRTVSEYFTPVEELERAGLDRLVRLGVGLEHPDDLVACLNWALSSFERLGSADLDAWRLERERGLGIYDDGAHG